jgi:hypothetical protein
MPRKEVIKMISYDWCIRLLDEHGDGNDSRAGNGNDIQFVDTLEEYRVQIGGDKIIDAPDPWLEYNEEIELCFYEEDDSGITNRAYALVDGETGTLPKTLDNGRRIPARFHKELKRIVDKVGKIGGYTPPDAEMAWGQAVALALVERAKRELREGK